MRGTRHSIRSESGFALLAAVIFVLVVTLVGMAFFSVTWFESQAAIYKQRSSEAFYLADGAVERLRARFLSDQGWRSGWAAVACGGGSYDLSVIDTTIAGVGPAVRVAAVGRVRGVSRAVRMTAELVPTALEMALVVSGDARMNGTPAVVGPVHVSGDGFTDLDPDPRIVPWGGYTEGFAVGPPAVIPRPDRFAGATYYFVAGTSIAGQIQARVYDAGLNDITTSLGDSLAGGIVSYSAPERRYTFAFRNADLGRYFDDATGIFRRSPGSSSVVIDFGATPPNAVDVTSSVVLEGGGPIHCTIVNSRFTGISDSDRLQSAFWTGGEVLLRQVVLEPFNGIALVADDLTHDDATSVTLGTPAWPALVYITEDAAGVGGNFAAVGTIVCLGDWESSGAPQLTRAGGYLPRLPAGLLTMGGTGVSGTMRILSWREVGAPIG